MGRRRQPGQRPRRLTLVRGHAAPTQRYSEADIAAEEERLGTTLPEELRRRYLDGVPDEVILSDGDEVVVAWAQDDVGNLGVVLRDGTLGWWKMHGGEVGPVQIDWDPSEDDLAAL